MVRSFLSARLAPFVGVLAGALALLSTAAPALAEAVGEIHLPPGFKAELVYAVPQTTQGSWVSLTVDERGRLIASDQGGGLYRLDPSPLGADPAKTKVEEIPMKFGMAQGLVCKGGDLYAMMNGRIGSFSSGLYRLSDTDHDDQFDRLEQLRVFSGEGEHGPHAVVLGPDGKSLYFTCGNFTALPRYDGTLVPPLWGEDQPLPRIYDPMGHGNNLQAPYGWIARSDLDGNNLEIVSAGYRNAYDIAFNADGELFTFDSDMEWDVGSPWYRPTRICHVVSGSDYGFRSGNGVWPTYYPDTLPSVVDVGAGSPTGMMFGAGSKFPPRYQQALFAGDWSYGNIYAIHLAPSGSSYRGEVERFASAMPLGVTDMAVRPQDGALYFTVGGRSSESAVYRIIYTGDTSPPSPAATNSPALAPPSPAELAAAAAARDQRHALEKLLNPPPADALDKIWPQLSNSDRFIRYAARAALERQPWQSWHERVAAEPDPVARVTALVALARSAQPEEQAEWVEALSGVAFDGAPKDQRLALIRAAALGAIRFDPLMPPTRERLLAQFDKHYPSGDREVDRELAKLLVRLKAPGLVERLLTQLERSATQEEGIDAAISLSAITDGWSTAQRVRLLDWFDAAAKIGGGRSCFGYIVAARDRFTADFPPADRQAFHDRISRPLVEAAEKMDAAARPFVREWKLDELVDLVDHGAGPRNFASGRKMFSAASCYKCHRVAGEGSTVGPDLTGVGRRFGVRDLLKSIVQPSAAISDQYQQIVYDVGGRTIVGRITNIAADTVSISTDMLDPKAAVDVPRREIDEQHPSPVSVMPEGLLNTLSAEEILDLVAFLRAAGTQTTSSSRSRQPSRPQPPPAVSSESVLNSRTATRSGFPGERGSPASCNVKRAG